MYLRMGQVESARSLLSDALAIFRDRLPPHHMAVLKGSVYLASAARRTGDFGRANRLLQQALRQQAGRPTASARPWRCGSWAFCTSIRERPWEGTGCSWPLPRCASGSTRVTTPSGPGLCWTCRVFTSGTGDPAEARRLAEDALQIYRLRLRDGHASIMEAEHLLGAIEELGSPESDSSRRRLVEMRSRSPWPRLRGTAWLPRP